MVLRTPWSVRVQRSNRLLQVSLLTMQRPWFILSVYSNLLVYLHSLWNRWSHVIIEYVTSLNWLKEYETGGNYSVLQSADEKPSWWNVAWFKQTWCQRVYVYSVAASVVCRQSLSLYGLYCKTCPFSWFWLKISSWNIQDRCVVDLMNWQGGIDKYCFTGIGEVVCYRVWNTQILSWRSQLIHFFLEG